MTTKKIGIVGGGQLARMMIQAGTKLGFEFRILSEKIEEATAGLCEITTGSYEDSKVHREFAAGLDCVTYEFENLPTSAIERLAELLPVYPPPIALEIGQDRTKEKKLFERLGIKTTKHATVNDAKEVRKVLEIFALPLVIKTTRLGYDGKGQAVIKKLDGLESILASLGEGPYLIEEFVNFSREVSLLATRGQSGEIGYYPLVENIHKNGILRRSTAPAVGSLQVFTLAKMALKKILEELNYCGVLAVEFFQCGEELIANEIAPRVHNTGHWTIEGAATSQFENHIRAIAGLPLGSTEAKGYSVMLNAIGDIPTADQVMGRSPLAHYHNYNKSPRPGRKVGHITINQPNAELTQRAAEEVEKLLM